MPLPTGIITIWHGAIVNIPAGWVLCDGNNGTPDLRDRFIVGAGNSFPVGNTGGGNTHTHTFTGDGHNHAIASGVAISAGTGYATYTSTDPDTGTTDPSSSLPPYYALAYIMKT